MQAKTTVVKSANVIIEIYKTSPNCEENVAVWVYK